MKRERSIKAEGRIVTELNTLKYPQSESAAFARRPGPRFQTIIVNHL